VYNSFEVVIVGLAIRISIPFRNLHAGVEEIGPLENGRKSVYLTASLCRGFCRKPF
jgi:hypothetical protein